MTRRRRSGRPACRRSRRSGGRPRCRRRSGSRRRLPGVRPCRRRRPRCRGPAPARWLSSFGLRMRPMSDEPVDGKGIGHGSAGAGVGYSAKPIKVETRSEGLQLTCDFRCATGAERNRTPYEGYEPPPCAWACAKPNRNAGFESSSPGEDRKPRDAGMRMDFRYDLTVDNRGKILNGLGSYASQADHPGHTTLLDRTG